jgi:hypothetical protein
MIKHTVRTMYLAIAIWGLTGLLWHGEAAAQAWPNEPQGSTVLTDRGFDCIACDGWGFTNDPRTTIGGDTSAPSPPNVLQMRFTSGVPGGQSVGNVYYPLNSLRELYAGFWWKPGATWNGGTGGQKINFMMGDNGKWNIVMLLYADHKINIYFPNSVGVNNCHLPGVWGDCPGTVQVYANVSNPTITLGVWHRMELYIKQSTSPTSRDGIIKWWIGGALCGDFTNVNFPEDRLIQYEFDATWGNIGDVNAREFFFSYNNVRLSTGGTLKQGNTAAPPTPTALRVN